MGVSPESTEHQKNGERIPEPSIPVATKTPKYSPLVEVDLQEPIQRSEIYGQPYIPDPGREHEIDR
jgi:hypothetical protein